VSNAIQLETVKSFSQLAGAHVVRFPMVALFDKGFDKRTRREKRRLDILMPQETSVAA
jgi:hypothetical protein